MLLGYTLADLRQAVAEGGTLEGLRARASTVGEGEARNPDGHQPSLPAFSREEFYNRLITFIVADDQVCLLGTSTIVFTYPVQSINLIECKEFRELLLFLRESLRDSDIPHRTSLRNKVVESWKLYLAALRKELGVSTALSCPAPYNVIPPRSRLVEFHLQPILGQRETGPVSLLSPLTGSPKMLKIVWRCDRR